MSILNIQYMKKKKTINYEVRKMSILILGKRNHQSRIQNRNRSHLIQNRNHLIRNQNRVRLVRNQSQNQN